VPDLFRRLSQDPQHPVFHPETEVQLHFGTEDEGLSLEEFAIMNLICRLETADEVPSMNISHAVLLALHLVQTEIMHQIPQKDDFGVAERLPPGRLEHPRRAIREWLLALGVDLDSRRQSLEVSLNRVLLSHCPLPEDVRLVEKVLFQTVEKLKKQSSQT
jgi:tRNA C32,U32 (ribose-2'-O)-methylase TrmJ